MDPFREVLYLWPLCLHPPQAVCPIDHSVLRDGFKGVQAAASPDDATAGQDDIPADVCCSEDSYNLRHQVLTFLIVFMLPHYDLGIKMQTGLKRQRGNASQ